MAGPKHHLLDAVHAKFENLQTHAHAHEHSCSHTAPDRGLRSTINTKGEHHAAKTPEINDADPGLYFLKAPHQQGKCEETTHTINYLTYNKRICVFLSMTGKLMIKMIHKPITSKDDFRGDEY